MRAFIVVSHGDFAHGLKMSVEMIAGPQEKLYSVSLEPSEGTEDLVRKLQEVTQKLNDFEEVIIFVDLLGGSPGNTSVANYFVDSRFQFISGVNFPMLLTALLDETMDVEGLIATGQEGIVNIRTMVSDMDEDE